MSSTRECWEVVAAAVKQSQSQVAGQQPSAALSTLVAAKLPVEAFTDDRLNALCCLIGERRGGGRHSESVPALRLLAQWGLRLPTPVNSHPPPEITQHALHCALDTLRDAFASSEAAAAALHCAGVLSHQLTGPPAEVALRAILSTCNRSHTEGSTDVPMEATLGLAHCCVAAANGVGNPELSAGFCSQLLLRHSSPAPTLLPVLSDLFHRIADAILLPSMTSDAALVEPTADSPPRKHHSRAPQPCDRHTAFLAVAAEVCRALRLGQTGWNVDWGAVSALAAGAVLWAWHTHKSQQHGAEEAAEVSDLRDALVRYAAVASGADTATPARAVALAIVPLWQLSSSFPPLSLATFSCCVRAALEGGMQLVPFLTHIPRSESEALAYLEQIDVQLPTANSLAAMAVEQLGRLDPTEAMAMLLTAVLEWARDAHYGYSGYVASAPAEWLDAGSRIAVALRLSLDRAVRAALLLLRGAGALGDSNSDNTSLATHSAAQVLDVLAYLEFTRSANTEHAALVTATLRTIGATPAQAAAVLSLLPSIVNSQTADGHRDSSKVDLVAGSRALLLLRAAVIALPAASEIDGQHKADALMPAISVNLAHPAAPLRASAHELAMRLLGGVKDSGQKHLAEAIAAVYFRDALSAFPNRATIEQLAAGTSAALSAVAPSSMLPVWMMNEAGRKAVCLMGSDDPSGAAPTTSTSLGKAAEHLFQLSVEVLLQIGVQAQPRAMQVMGDLLMRARKDVQARLLAALHAGLANSDDWVMKLKWVRWYQDLAATIASPQIFNPA